MFIDRRRVGRKEKERGKKKEGRNERKEDDEKMK